MYSNSRLQGRLGLLMACSFTLVGATRLSANDWDNGSGDARWSNAVNWSGNIEPNSGTSANFPAGFPNGDVSIVLDAGEAAFLLSFGDSYTLRNVLSAQDTATLALGNGVVHAVGGKTASILVRVSSTAGLNKIGAGTANFHRTNTFPSGEVSVDDGALGIMSGGSITCSNGVIAPDAGFNATVNVAGTNSLWTMSAGLFGGSLNIGSAGTGTLNISGGGRVTNNGAFLASSIGGSATVNISGVGSSWNPTSISMGPGPSVVINITGGTLLTHQISAGGGVSTITLDGGTLDTQGSIIGSSGFEIDNFNLRSGTLKNVSEINGGAGVTKNSPGTLILDGVVSYTGTTVVSEGTLTLGASQQLQSLTVTPSARFGVLLGGTSAGTGYPQLTLTGNANLAGAVDVTLTNGFVPQIGDSFVIMTFASRTGAFTQVTGSSAGTGKVFRLQHNPTNVTLVVSALAGDMNCDGQFNAGDIGPFALALVDPAAYALQFPACQSLNGDFNQDSVLNGRDVGLFANCIINGGCQ